MKYFARLLLLIGLFFGINTYAQIDVTATAFPNQIDPIVDSVVVHFHPINSTIGATNGRLFEVYTSEFELISQLILIDDPTIFPQQYNFQLSPDGTKLAIVLYGVPMPPNSTVLQMWDMVNGEKLYEIPGIDVISPIAWEGDSKYFAASVTIDRNESVIQVFDASNGEKLQEIIPPNPIQQLVWSPIGNFLVFDSRDNIQIWDAITGDSLPPIDILMEAETELVFHPTENLIAVVNKDNLNVIEIWDIENRKLIGQLSGHTERVSTLNWGVGGLVSTDFDSKIHIWNVQTGESSIIEVGLYPRAELNATGTILLVKDQTTGIYTLDAVTGKMLNSYGSQ